jgi:hypothetical protein
LASQLACALALNVQLGGCATTTSLPANWVWICVVASVHHAVVRLASSVSLTLVGSAPRSTAMAWQAAPTSVTAAVVVPAKSAVACMKALKVAAPSPSTSQSTAPRSAPTLKSLQHSVSAAPAI